MATLPQQSEAALQAQIIELARLLNFRVAHFRAARTEKGWRTPVAADGAGFPDLTLCKPGRLIFVEVKSHRGRLSAAQREWIEALRAAGQEVYVWRPDDFDEIERVLRGGA